MRARDLKEMEPLALSDQFNSPCKKELSMGNTIVQRKNILFLGSALKILHVGEDISSRGFFFFYSPGK